MIIDNRVNFNTYREKILDNYSQLDYVCPKCGAKHSLIRHAIYERNVCYIDNGNNICDNKIQVLRLKCKSCNSTHAILPNDVIPYCIYSFSIIIDILIKHFINNKKVLAIGNELIISFQLIYSLIKRFQKFVKSCLLVLKSLGFDNVSTEIPQILEAINQYKNNHNDFLHQYFLNSKWIFLMTKFHNILSPPIFISSSG